MSQNSLHSYETHRLIQISLLIAIKAVLCNAYCNCSEINVLPFHDFTLLQNSMTEEHSALITIFCGCLKVMINS